MKLIETTEKEIKLKSFQIMFPRNHNCDVKTILGEVYKDGSAKTVIEHFSRNVYLNNKYSDAIKYNSEEEMFNYMNDKMIEISQTEQFLNESSKFETEKQFLISVY